MWATIVLTQPNKFTKAIYKVTTSQLSQKINKAFSTCKQRDEVIAIPLAGEVCQKLALCHGLTYAFQATATYMF